MLRDITVVNQSRNNTLHEKHAVIIIDIVIRAIYQSAINFEVLSE